MVTVVNDLATPSYTAATSAGSASINDATDADLGACKEIGLTGGGAGASLEARITNGGTRVPVRARQLVYYRASAKVTSGAGFYGLVLYFYNAAGSVVGSGVAINIPNNLDYHELEGFHTAPDGAVSVLAAVTFVTSTATGTLRVSRPLLSVDPWGDVPVYTASETEAEPTVTEHWGFNDNPFQHPDPEISFAEQLQIVKSLGANTVRFALTMSLIEEYPQTSEGGAINWRNTVWGEYLDAIRGAGLKALPIAWQAPAWMNSGNHALKDLPTNRYDDFAAIYADLCEEWSDIIVGIELHNEPNLSFFWNFDTGDSDDPDPEIYTDLLKVFYPAIKAVTPDVKVLAGAISHRQTSTSNNLSVIDFLDGMVSEDFEDYADGVSIHPYASGNRSGSSSPVGDWGAGTWPVINQVRARTALPIWATEFGYPAATFEEERYQAQVNVLTRGMLARQDDIEAVFIHGAVPENDSDLYYPIVKLPGQFSGSAQVL